MKNRLCFCCGKDIATHGKFSNYKGRKFCWNCKWEVEKEITYLYRQARRYAAINIRNKHKPNMIDCRHPKDKGRGV